MSRTMVAGRGCDEEGGKKYPVEKNVGPLAKDQLLNTRAGGDRVQGAPQNLFLLGPDRCQRWSIASVTRS